MDPCLVWRGAQRDRDRATRDPRPVVHSPNAFAPARTAPMRRPMAPHDTLWARVRRRQWVAGAATNRPPCGRPLPAGPSRDGRHGGVPTSQLCTPRIGSYPRLIGRKKRPCESRLPRAIVGSRGTDADVICTSVVQNGARFNRPNSESSFERPRAPTTSAIVHGTFCVRVVAVCVNKNEAALPPHQSS